VEPGRARRSQVEHGGARWSQEEPGGARRTQEEPGGARSRDPGRARKRKWRARRSQTQGAQGSRRVQGRPGLQLLWSIGSLGLFWAPLGSSWLFGAPLGSQQPLVMLHPAEIHRRTRAHTGIPELLQTRRHQPSAVIHEARS
jgi:hypothetical protein